VKNNFLFIFNLFIRKFHYRNCSKLIKSPLFRNWTRRWIFRNQQKQKIRNWGWFQSNFVPTKNRWF